jgi:hypothetical protein
MPELGWIVVFSIATIVGVLLAYRIGHNRGCDSTMALLRRKGYL